MCDTTGEYERSLSHFCFNDSITYCKLHELHKCVSNLKRNQGSSYKEVNATHILKNPEHSARFASLNWIWNVKFWVRTPLYVFIAHISEGCDEDQLGPVLF